MSRPRAAHKQSVLVVEDHTLMADAIRARLEKEAGMTVGAVVSTATEALAEFPQRAYDLVLTDVALARRGSGLDLVRRLKVSHPQARVCVYSAAEDPGLVQELFDAGAGGFIRKTASVAEFVESVHAVADGQESVMDRDTARDMLVAARNPGSFGAYAGPPLTPREVQVLTELVSGAKTDTIGRRLGITARTVQNHVERILAKTGASSRVHLVSLAHELELLPKRRPARR